MSVEDVIKELEARIGPLPSRVRAELDSVEDIEDRDIMREELAGCQSLAEVESLATFLRGRASGRLEGLRQALYVVLGSRDDESAEILEEKAFSSTDVDELEALIKLAASSIGITCSN